MKLEKFKQNYENMKQKLSNAGGLSPMQITPKIV